MQLGQKKKRLMYFLRLLLLVKLVALVCYSIVCPKHFCGGCCLETAAATVNVQRERLVCAVYCWATEGDVGKNQCRIASLYEDSGPVYELLFL